MQPQIQQETIADLVKQVGSKKKEESEAARLRLKNMGNDGIAALLEIVSAEREKQKVRQKWAVAGFIGWIVFVITISIITHSGGLIGMVGSMSGLITAAAISQQQKNTASALSLFDDKRAVAPLIEALGYNDPNLAKLASDALTKLLPTLQASDAVLLNTDHYKILNRQLAGKNIDFALAILKAYEQIGDMTAVPIVQKLAEGQGQAKKEVPLKEAAAACLPLLQKNAQANEARQHLLRAANESSLSPETLLRPATNTPELQPELLLRASDTVPETEISAGETAHAAPVPQMRPAAPAAEQPLVARNGTAPDA